MIPPPGQRLLLGNLIDLLDKAHGSVRVILVFQHLPHRLLRVHCQCPGLNAPGVLPCAGV
ncbi:MAG: hypothetical protein IKE08_10225 [Clostridia bacterium]|nr:hypothetical protein [Clostridia bacterium]